MKRLTTIVCVLAGLVLASSAMAADYGFTISGSSTDPWTNAPAPTPGLTSLYLHWACNEDIGPGVTGMGAFESGFDFNVAPIAVNTNPVAVFANVGDIDDLILSMQGCQQSGNYLVTWLIIDGTGGGLTACYRPTTVGIPGGSNTIAAIDCDFPANFRPIDYMGFDSTGGAPCEQNLFPLCTTAVEQSSWGEIKALYR